MPGIQRPRILHVSVLDTVDLNPGVLVQSDEENRLSADDFAWTSLIFYNHGDPLGSAKRIPIGFRGRVRCRLFLMLYVMWNVNRFDFIIIRRAPLDFFTPILLLFWSSKVSYICHTDELSLLRNRSYVFYYIEKCIRIVFFRKLKFFVAVTREIATLNSRFLSRTCRVLLLPNGVVEFPKIDGPRSKSDEVVVCFVASKFYDWNGLEALLKDFEVHPFLNVKLKLAGAISASQNLAVQGIDRVFHLDTISEDKGHFYSDCDVALGAFKLSKVGITEACTLKIREALSYGIPVYSGHRDVAFSGDEVFFKIGKPNLQEIYDFGMSMKRFSPGEIQITAKSYIDKEKIISELVSGLESV